jgi:hypothetical protein
VLEADVLFLAMQTPDGGPHIKVYCRNKQTTQDLWEEANVPFACRRAGRSINFAPRSDFQVMICGKYVPCWRQMSRTVPHQRPHLPQPQQTKHRTTTTMICGKAMSACR